MISKLDMKNIIFLIIIAVIVILLIIFLQNKNLIINYIMRKEIIAIAVFNSPKIKGFINFYEDYKNKKTLIELNLQGLKKNGIHGFHIHEAGDLTENCMGACAHFNPFNKNHGGINSKERHLGDLGNIIADKDGNVKYNISDKHIKLYGTKRNIIGRSVVIHEDEDDNGLGGHDDSLTTGHAGKRLACAVIGYSKKMFI
jgi:Cu-Zn family superoxide dismutase